MILLCSTVVVLQWLLANCCSILISKIQCMFSGQLFLYYLNYFNSLYIQNSSPWHSSTRYVMLKMNTSRIVAIFCKARVGEVPCSTSGGSKLQPAGHIWPALLFPSVRACGVCVRVYVGRGYMRLHVCSFIPQKCWKYTMWPSHSNVWSPLLYLLLGYSSQLL